MAKLPASPEFGELRLLGTFLHLSDIHGVHGDASWQADQRMVLTELEHDIRGLDSKGIPQPGAVFITGDLGARGGKDAKEYEQVREFLRKISAALSLSATDPILLVPGNHDVHRTPPSDRQAFRLLRALRDGIESVDEALVASTDAEMLHGRFANYKAFAENLMPSIDGRHSIAWTREVQFGDELQARIVGLNTALLSNDDQDNLHLRLGMQQIERIQGDDTSGRLVITMTHHPIAWLAPDNTAEVEAWQFRYAQMHLHGHIHVPNASSVRWATGEQLLTIVAGAVHDEHQPVGIRSSHGYHVVALCAAADGRVIARVYPRIFAKEKKFKVQGNLTLEGELFAELPLKFRLPPVKVIAADASKAMPPSDKGGLNSLAQKLHERAGRRRTAYPTDFSVRELASRNLLVPSSLSDRSTRGSVDSQVGVSAIRTCLERGESVLVLGAPGGGKTVFAYETAAAMLRESTMVPLFVDLRSLAAKGVDITPENLLDLLSDVAHMPSIKGFSGACLIVDGVDERIAAGESAVDVADLLTTLGRIGPMLVTCRAEDYERTLAAVIPSDLFSRIFDLLPWSVEREFADFVSRLSSEGLVNAETVLRLVGEDSQLADLVERPLFARMLTYVIDVEQLPKSRTALYQHYLAKLGRTTDTALRATACYHEPRALELWRDAAWTVFDQHIGSGDDVPLAALLSALGRAGLSPDCAYRLLAAVMDIETSRGRMAASFIHYSFFEFLVAEHLALHLTSTYPDRSAEAVAALGQHIPQEIRRHLVRILRSSISDRVGWRDWLVRMYKAASSFSDAQRRTAANMLAYLACRLDLEVDSALRQLLDEEPDLMLQNSLAWALARLGAEEATWSWLLRLNTEPELGSLNRGYLLYYFGDLKQASPPYRDDEPYTDCTHTRAKLFEKLRDEAFERPVARKAVDLFSYLDLLAARGQKTGPDEQDVVERFAQLLYPRLEEDVRQVLNEKMAMTV